MYEKGENGRYKMNATKFASRCQYQKKTKPCDDEYFKRDCAKMCGGGSISPWMEEPYVHREPLLEEEKSYESRCAYEKAQGRCTSKYTAAKCKKTCASCKAGDKKCDDTPYMKHPFTQRVYKKKMYSSKCEYHKGYGNCKYDKKRMDSEKARAAANPKHKSRFKPPCQKTCTGEGNDSESYSKPYNGTVFNMINYKNRCEYNFKRREDPCKHDKNMANQCKMTCTGEGKDTGYSAKPYVHKVREIKETKKHGSRCAYVKKSGKCKSPEAAFCRKTCAQCATCKDYSSRCKYMKSSGTCTLKYRKHEAVKCPKTCGLCAAESGSGKSEPETATATGGRRGGGVSSGNGLLGDPLYEDGQEPLDAYGSLEMPGSEDSEYSDHEHVDSEYSEYVYSEDYGEDTDKEDVIAAL